MKVLVTGASGLLGSELCKQLTQHGFIVHAADDLSRGSVVLNCERFFNIDLTNKESLNKLDDDYDTVYHYAAINGTSNFYERPNDVLKKNTLIDFNVFDFASSLKSRPLVIYASSSEIVVGSKDKKLSESLDVSITDITNPRWSYRLAKITAENYLVNSNLNYLILRYFNVYGRHSKPGHFVYDQVDKVKNGVFSVIGPSETRSFCHVSDAVDATIYCSLNTSFDVINIGNDKEIKISKAANIIAETLGVDTSFIDWDCEEERKGSTRRRCPDITKLKRVYPEYKPMDFKEGIYRSLII